jgi:hypothetical protein
MFAAVLNQCVALLGDSFKGRNRVPQRLFDQLDRIESDGRDSFDAAFDGLNDGLDLLFA